jgi:hypothetical protein
MALNLTLPIPGTTSGIDAANELVTALEKVEVYFDTHDHTGGNGGLITPAAMSINADLPFNDNKLTTLKTCGFTSQASSPSVGTSLFVLNDDLWYNNGIIDIQLTTASGAFVTVNGLTDSYNNSSPSLGKLGYDAGTGTYFCSVGDTGSSLTSALGTVKAEQFSANYFTGIGSGLTMRPLGAGDILLRTTDGNQTFHVEQGNMELVVGPVSIPADGNIFIRHNSSSANNYVSVGPNSDPWSISNFQGALFIDGGGISGGIGSPNGARLGLYAIQLANPISGPNFTHIKTEGDSNLQIFSASDANLVSLGNIASPGPIMIAGAQGSLTPIIGAIQMRHIFDEFVIIKGSGTNGASLDARGSLRIENSGQLEAICKSNLTSHPSDFQPTGYGSTIAPVLEIGSTGDIYLGADSGTTYVDKGSVLNTGPIISVDTETNPFAITNNPSTMNAQNAIVARASFVVVPSTSVTPSVNNWNVASGSWVSAGVYDIILNTAPTNNDFSIVVTSNEAAPYFGSAVWNSAIPKLEVYFWDSSGAAADVTDFSLVAVGL